MICNNAVTSPPPSSLVRIITHWSLDVSKIRSSPMARATVRRDRGPWHKGIDRIETAYYIRLMAMGKRLRRPKQASMWATHDLPLSDRSFAPAFPGTEPLPP
jgi:hypothetical protein